MAKDTNGRVTNADRIDAAWATGDQNWPPELEEKVKMWWKDQRGKVATVVATENYAKKGYKSVRLSTSKVRVKCGEMVALVTKNDVFPVQFSVKDIERIEV